MFENIGSTEILILILVLIVLFGGSKITDLARGLGEATKEIKKAQKQIDSTKDELKKEAVIEDETAAKKKIRHLKKKKK